VDITDIEKSIELIAGSGVEYEFRTTAASTLLDEPDFLRIGCWLGGARLYVLQPCRPGAHLDPRFRCGGPDQLKWLNTVRRALEPYFGSVKVRGAAGTRTDAGPSQVGRNQSNARGRGLALDPVPEAMVGVGIEGSVAG
jgi:hypothetical protein